MHSRAAKIRLSTLTAGCLGILGFALCAPARAQVGSTVLPTDVTPISGKNENRPFKSTMQMRLWQHLPAAFYFNGTFETTERIETNPFQYPLKRTTMQKVLPRGTTLKSLAPVDFLELQNELNATSSLDNVYRLAPTLTAGWAFTPNTQVFCNYFMIRDTLARHPSLDTTTQAVSFGAQHSISLNDKVVFQPQVIARELWQNHEIPVLDYLPSTTLTYTPTNNLSLYMNALLQLRFAHFMSGYMREIDPFYTWGINYQRGRWYYSVSQTFLQNFRNQFGNHALTPFNQYTFVLDFEIDRQLFASVPGLVSVIRAEPVYNFHSHATPGLAGMDMRLYYGFRFSAAKPPLNGTINQLRQRYAHPSAAQAPDVNSIRRALLEDGAT